MSYKSYYNQQEPLYKNPINQSKMAKMEKPKKPKKNRKNRKKNRKKTSPKFEFEVAFGFFWIATPPIVDVLTRLISVTCPDGKYKSDGMNTCTSCDAGEEPNPTKSACGE